MEDPEKTEVENKESQAINNGCEGGSNELSQQSVSLDTASGETAERESTALLKEGDNEESLECSHDTKSGKKKKKKRRKKKAEMTNVAPDNTEQLWSTLTSDVEETNTNIASATRGQTCEELDPTEDSPVNKKNKKKKKKKKTETKVCGTLGKQLDNQDISSAPKEEKSVEDQGDLAVKNEKQENDADSKLQKECGDAGSGDSRNERENMSEDSPADTEAARVEEGNVPAPEKEDVGSSENMPNLVKPKLALEKQLDNQDIGSAPNEEESVEDQCDLDVVKNGKQENDADTKFQKECGDAVSGDIGYEREHLSEDSPADTDAGRTEGKKVSALEKKDRGSSEMGPDELKPELATISRGAKESDSDTDMPVKVGAMESDSADNVSDEPDNEG